MDLQAPARPHPRAASGAQAADAPSGGAVAVFERREFERALSARVLPARHWAKLDELDQLIARVNALYGEVEAEIARARAAGQAEGFAEGLRRAQ